MFEAFTASCALDKSILNKIKTNWTLHTHFCRPMEGRPANRGHIFPFVSIIIKRIVISSCREQEAKWLKIHLIIVHTIILYFPGILYFHVICNGPIHNLHKYLYIFDTPNHSHGLWHIPRIRRTKQGSNDPSNDPNFEQGSEDTGLHDPMRSAQPWSKKKIWARIQGRDPNQDPWSVS